MSREFSDELVAENILEISQQRGREKSLCPSEVARVLLPNDWRSLMPDVRSVAGKMTRQGFIKITQKGKEVDPEAVKGPIRISLR